MINPTPSSSAFDQIAQAYELLVNEESRWERERAFLSYWVDAARQNSPDPDESPTILDLGCGTGFHARHLAQHLHLTNITGADPAQPMLDVASNKHAGHLVNWICAPAESPPPGPFNLTIMLGNTLSLIKDIKPVFQALHTVTKPQSLFICQMLDYQKLRAVSTAPRVTERHNQTVDIRKSLEVRKTPSRKDDIAADLNLIIKDRKTGKQLSAEHHHLHEHPESTWLPYAQSIGWELHRKQSTFLLVPPTGLPTTPPTTPQTNADRVYILRRTQ